jgi:hypothetical protein
MFPKRINEGCVAPGIGGQEDWVRIRRDSRGFLISFGGFSVRVVIGRAPLVLMARPTRPFWNPGKCRTFAQTGTVVLRCFSDDMTPDDAFLTINGNMAFGTDSWDREIHRLTPVCTHLRLGLFVRRANTSSRFSRSSSLQRALLSFCDTLVD